MDTIFCKGVFKIDTFSFVPHRDVKVSFRFSNSVTSFFSGAKQINRHRIHAEKSFSFIVSGLKVEMDALVAFYNAQHGSKCEFLFNYDGIEEHCYFAEPITISEIRELNKVVGYNAEVNLGCVHQVSPYTGTASISDVLNVTPKGTVEHKIDWNTKMVSMIANGRQETYIEPTESFIVTLVGTKEERDELLALYNIHGSMPFTFVFDNRSYRVRFPDNIEITDKRSMTVIQGFESKFELEVVKNPKDGTYYEEATDFTSAIIVKENISLYRWYANGCPIDGISYKDDIKRGVQKLQKYRITEMTEAFMNCKGLDILPELDTSQCTSMTRCFYNSSIKVIRGLDFSNLYGLTQTFAWAKIQSFECPLDFPNVTNAQEAFTCWGGMRVIPYVSLPKATNIMDMYSYAYIDSIEGLYVPNCNNYYGLFQFSTVKHLPTFDIKNVQEMKFTFAWCPGLKELHLINCNNLTRLDSLCLCCSDLTSVTGLNLTNADNDYRNLSTDWFEGIFQGCIKLKTITVIEDGITSREALKNKYYSFMINYGLGDGRGASRHIEHFIIANSQGKVIERYDRYGNERSTFA